jgi:transposase
MQPVISEHRLWASWCCHCQTWGKPDLPAEVGRSAFGPRLQAWVAILPGRFRQSRRQVVELWRALGGVSLSLGSIQSLGEETSEALAVPYREAKEAVAPAERVHLDETGWKEKGKRHWLWVAVTRLTTVFLVSCSRGRKALGELIGESFEGLLPSERWGAYNIVEPRRRQLCGAQLQRDFQARSERKTRAGPLGNGD